MINNPLAITGIFGVVLEIFSPYLFYISKGKSGLILIILSNILIGISLIYFIYYIKSMSIPQLYDIYLLYKIKIGYKIGLFAWSIMCGMTLVFIIIEKEKKYYIQKQQ